MLRFQRYILLSLTIAAVPAAAQQAPRAQPTSSPPPVDSFYPLELRPANVTMPHDSVDIPLEILDGRPTVLMMINGRGPFRFAVETGAATLALRADVAQALGYSATDYAQWVPLDSVNVGTATFHTLHAKILSTSASRSFGTTSIGGLLGLCVYYDLLLTIDPGRRRLNLTRGVLPAVNHRDIFSLEPIAGQWYGMESWVDGTRHVAFLDTQSPSAFNVTPSQVVDSQFTTLPALVGVAKGPSLGTQPKRQGRLRGNIRVGGVIFQQPVVAITPIPSDALQRWIIGWDALQHFTITLDQRQRRLRLISSDSVVIPPPSVLSAGAQWESDTAGRFRISYVLPGGSADRQGFQVGDILVSFDETPVTESTEPALPRARARGEGRCSLDDPSRDRNDVDPLNAFRSRTLKDVQGNLQ